VAELGDVRPDWSLFDWPRSFRRAASQLDVGSPCAPMPKRLGRGCVHFAVDQQLAEEPRRRVSPVGADRVSAGRSPGRGSVPPKPLGRP
jgi:hypothetical protein